MVRVDRLDRHRGIADPCGISRTPDAVRDRKARAAEIDFFSDRDLLSAPSKATAMPRRNQRGLAGCF